MKLSNIGVCSDALCSTSEQCCPIPNGKSYCNVKRKRCETLRYCPESSSNEECPFNDLSAAELANVIKIIKKSKLFSSELNFPIVRKQEPKKKIWNSGAPAARERIAYAAVQDLGKNRLSEVLVSLRSQRVISVDRRKVSVTPLTQYEIETAQKIFSTDANIKRAYERRGLNGSYAASHEWVFGAFGNGKVNGRRLVKSVPYYNEPGTK